MRNFIKYRFRFKRATTKTKHRHRLQNANTKRPFVYKMWRIKPPTIIKMKSRKKTVATTTAAAPENMLQMTALTNLFTQTNSYISNAIINLIDASISNSINWCRFTRNSAIAGVCAGSISLSLSLPHSLLFVKFSCLFRLHFDLGLKYQWFA